MAFQNELLVTIILGFFALAGTGISYRKAKTEGKSLKTWFFEWFAEFSTELAGAALITFAILFLVVPAQKQDRMEEYIRMMSSSDNTIARQASESLFFLYDDGEARWNGSLRNRNFAHADWTDMHMTRAALQGSNLSSTILVRTILKEAELVSVDLSGANLSGADLTWADLTRAIITSKTIFDETTQLPDGSRWGSNGYVDLSRFTNPNHPNYWDPCKQPVIPTSCGKVGW